MLGEITSLNNLFMRTGVIIGPLLAGFISDYFGLEYVFILTAIIASIIAIIALFLHGYNSFVDEK